MVGICDQAVSFRHQCVGLGCIAWTLFNGLEPVETVKLFFLKWQFGIPTKYLMRDRNGQDSLHTRFGLSCRVARYEYSSAHS